ncbi:MAG: hypothetical protein JST04_10125 [Bdellovibrionales bacterium]|nr:hypothetical protein [Bdellovibrionales bacterium]
MTNPNSSRGRAGVLVAVTFAVTQMLSCAHAPNREPGSETVGAGCPVPANKGDPRLHAKDPGFSYCAQFIAPDCRTGELGEAMRGYFAPTGLSTFVKDPPGDVLTYCPKYARLDEETRERFWIWTFMSIAYEEGGCGEPSVVQAVRDYYGKYKGTKLASAVPADSTYALPWRDTDRKGRPDFCRDTRIGWDQSLLEEITYPGETGAKSGALAPSAVAGPKAGARCAMAMLADQLKRSGRLMDPKSYWQKLRRAGTLSARLPKFGPCGGE